MSIALTILGCHSATPRAHAHPTAQYLQINNRHFLIDCGEGTQQQLRKYKIGFSKINHIFISHLHGDHFFGLIGLVATLGILNREKTLHIYGPVGIEESIRTQLKLTHTWIQYPLEFHELNSTDSEIIFEDDQVCVKTIPLDHRVYTNGFLFTEKEKNKRLHIENITQYPEIDRSDYHHIKAGKAVTLTCGEVIPNSELTLPTPPLKSYAFCSDTAYKPSIVPLLKNVTLLYHEATFLESHAHLTKKTKHSTAKQAAEIAKLAEVSTLILGHYSSRYPDISEFKKEAQTVFKKVELAQAGAIFSA